MDGYGVMPMNLALWRQRLRALCDGAAEAEPGEADDCLREAYALLAVAPRGLGSWLPVLPHQRAFDALLAAGGGESAALALLPDEAGYLLSRGASGANLASVVLPGRIEDISSQGASAALALVSARAGALSSAGGDVLFPAADDLPDHLRRRPPAWLN